MANDAKSILGAFKKSYDTNTSRRLKICDAFIVFFLLNAMVLLAYCVTVGSFPFNAYLGALFANVGLMVFTVSLRMQAAPANKPQFRKISIESAFCDFSLCSILLLFTAVHFMG